MRIVYKRDAHVMKHKENSNFNSLIDYISKTFKQLPPNYRLVYLDDDGD